MFCELDFLKFVKLFVLKVNEMSKVRYLVGLEERDSEFIIKNYLSG